MDLPFRLLLILGAFGLAAADPISPAVPTATPLQVVQKLPETVAAGTPFLVEITLRNNTSLALDTIQVIDTLPAGCQAQEAMPAAESSPDRLNWSIPRLGPGEERRFQITLVRRLDAPATPIRNAVEVVCSTRLSNVAATRIAAPQLTLEVQAPQVAVVGEPATLWITANNCGTVAARNVTLQTLLPVGLSHPQGSDLELPLEPLAPASTRKLPLPVTPTRSGEFRARVALLVQGAPPIVREVSLVAQDIRLTVAARGPETLPQQLTGLFELTVHNDGAACPVSVTVLLPEGLTFDRASDRGVYDPQTHSIRWDLGELRSAATRVLAWNGAPRQAGDMAFKVRLTSCDRVRQEASWKVRVIPGGDASVRTDMH